MPAKNNQSQYKVGDRIQISLNNRILDVTIKAVVQTTSGLRQQVEFGKDNCQTALIHEWQVVKS